MNHSLHSGYNTPLLRYWQSASCTLTRDNLIYPIFVSSKPDAFDDIKGLPEQRRIGVDKLVAFLQPLVAKGLKCVLIFGVIDGGDLAKDERGSAADCAKSPVIAAVKVLRQHIPELIVGCDVCLCTYTPNHHCYISDNKGEMDVKRTVNRLAEIALNYAQSGAHIIAPSDMSEGRILAIKEILLKSGLSRQVSVMSYAAKFASSFYGPFRSAAGSGDGNTDRKSYQLPPGASGLAIRTALRDANEGADIIMVKPGLLYLDVIANIRNALPNHPMAVYHVSGEYAMLMAGAKAGCIDLKSASLEIMLAFRRAGASVIITYLTPYLLDLDLTEVFR